MKFVLYRCNNTTLQFLNLFSFQNEGKKKRMITIRVVHANTHNSILTMSRENVHRKQCTV